MFIRANRDINSDSYKINRLKYMMGKDLWTLAEVKIPNLVDGETMEWKYHWEPLYIKVVSIQDYNFDDTYPKFYLNFVTVDSVERGVLGLSTYEKNLDSLNRTDEVLISSYKDINCDFKELLSTEELLYKIMNTEYRYW